MVVVHEQHLYKNWHQIYSILIVCLNTISAGQTLSWTSPSVPILLEEGVSRKESTYLVMFQSGSAIIASLFVCKLIDLIGRRSTILCVTISYSITWILTVIAANATVSSASGYLPRPLYIYYAARAFTGIGDACTFSAIPTYVTEISTPSIRGTWGNCVALSIFIGLFSINVIGAYLSIANTAYVCLLLPVVFILNYYFLKESPYYLLMKGRVDEARSALQWLRNTSPAHVEEELRQLRHDVQRQMSEKGRFYDLIKIKSNRKACIAGILMRSSQQFSGIVIYLLFSQLIFIESGSDLSPSVSAIVITAILMIAIGLSSFVLDILGRRKAMLISCTGCSVVLFIQTVFFYLKDKTDLSVNGLQMFPLISMVVYMLFYAIGLGLVPTLMLGELFSSSAKSNALVVMNIVYSLSAATSVKIFSFCFGLGGMYAGVLFLTVCCTISIGVSYWVVPETRGKTLEEIQQAFKKS